MRLPADNLLRRLASHPLAGAWLSIVFAICMSSADAATYTVTKTADTSDGVCNADCSLREALTVAVGGGDIVAFNIPLADPGYSAGTGVFTIAPGSPLPAISGANTTIDGTTQTANVGNTNPTVHGTGGLVGVNEEILLQVNGPEIEILGQNTIAAGLRVSANNTVIRGLAIYGFGNANGEGDIVVDNGVNGGTFEFNVLGARAHLFADPAPGPRSRAGFASNGGDAWTLQNNVIGFGQTRGAYIVNASQNWVVQGNEFVDGGLVDIGGDNIAIEGNSTPGTVSANLIRGAASQGLVISGTNANTIINNTFRGNGVGHVGTPPAQSGALTLRSTADNVDIKRNIFDANYGPGLMINNGSIDTRYTRNHFFDNGTILSRNGSGPSNQIAVDLQEPTDNQNLGTPPYFNLNDDGDGDSGGNDILNFPVIETAQILGPNLVVSGYVTANASIEFYLGDADPGNWGEGQIFLFKDDEGSGNDNDGTTGSYGPGAVNGVVQGEETNVPRFSFTVPLATLPVPVTSSDEIVATATDATQTSEFSARAPAFAGNIGGTVFVDIVGDGLADGPIGPLPNPFESGTRIELWLDGGDDLPDGGDDVYQSFTTSALADGTYAFSSLSNGTYWVTVDAGGVNRGPYNGGYSGADAWAEQTYGPVGAATYDGVSWSFAPTAGAVYGGARWDQSDRFPPANSLPTAEHIARVVVNNNDTANVDFGFSFNVVTTTRGGDATADPGTPPGQRTVQGSLYQFITNANAGSGANAMRFVPAAPTNASSGGHSWWQIPVTAALPQVLDVTTTIDGAALDAADGVTPVDPNTAAIGSGAAVGVSGTFNTPQLDPELELRGDGVVSLGLDIQPAADGSSVRNLAINAFTINAARLIGTTADALDSVTFENTVLGASPASFTDVPALNVGRGVFGRDLTNSTIRNNLVGWYDWGLQVQFDTFDSVIETNEIRGSTTYGIYLGGVAGTGQQPARVTMRGNLVEESGSQGINTQQSLNQLTIDENTVRLTGGHAVRAYGVQNTITGNIIADNSGTGLLVIGDNLPGYPAASQNRISQNRFGNNTGLAIDLVANGVNADGITLNDDLDADTSGANELHNYPVIESAILAGGNLTVTGYVRPGVEIEFYEAVGAANDQNGGGTAHGEGIDYLFSATEGAGADTDGATGSYASADYGSDTSANRFRFVVPAPAGLALGEELSAISIDTTNDTSEFGPNVTVNPPYTIVKRAFLPDGTPVGDGSSLPVGVGFKWLLYINNNDGATSDASIRDVLDPLFAYQAGSLQVDNSVTACAAAACTPAEESAIFTAVSATALLTDVIDGDVASFNGTDTIDAGNQNVANGQLDIAANSVLALMFSAKVQ
ncbi:MAG: right-handed parallel beta-helix repeat-containing protein [Gammaproteobacteria bacterium]|nr:right-handed parallel beta-helix repeat-containing protein [Gammaproteobacteria bacterium]NNF60594.1 CSLREA domain-containing protein [Gammaproteobacteria bacterium]NNM21378.1 CSLREA domain-containing protein [Gammaproteobacteria bacterium]